MDQFLIVTAAADIGTALVPTSPRPSITLADLRRRGVDSVKGRTTVETPPVSGESKKSEVMADRT
jgi:hypothetical protein